jgi:SAM-dependent methyltransferase
MPTMRLPKGSFLRQCPRLKPEANVVTNQDPADRSTSQSLYERAWAESYELTDLQLSPLGLHAIQALGLRLGDVVLDIGCGTGQTLLQLAERVGPDGQVTGVDLARSLLQIASRRANHLKQVSLIHADAASLDLPSGSAEAVFSRFGVMGFDNPIAAFTNFKRILKPAGSLAFVCWRSLEENELDHLPLMASGIQTAVDERPFSFADPDYIRASLGASGFRDIAVRAHDEKVSSGDIDAMVKVLLKVGPLGKFVRQTPSLQRTAEPLVREALAALGDPSHVQLTASVWIVSARA